MVKYSDEFLKLLDSITAKRPKTVIQHILKHGFITSQELKDLYGYNHPPRAIRDVREYGIPIDTYRVKGEDGRSIAAYKFGNPDELNHTPSKSSGRTVITKAIKKSLIDIYGSKCFIYLEEIPENELQVDHRIPYEIAGEQEFEAADDFMLLSPSANRAKSWTCEHCPNWNKRDAAMCRTCFWAHPENYEHIAGRFEKIVTILFSGDEIDDYHKIVEHLGTKTIQEFIKEMIKESMKKK